MEIKMKQLRMLGAKIREMCSLDERSLALYRFTVALSTIFDMLDRMSDLRAHYTDEGVLSRQLVLEKFWNWTWFSFFMMSGTPFFTFIMFILAIIVSFCMMIGFYTKLSTFLTWCFVISAQGRNILVGHGGDSIHRLALFFAMFLPTSERFSVDAMMEDKPVKKKRSYVFIGVPALALMIQIFVMYWSAHSLKTSDEWRVTRISTWLALQLDFFRKPFGDLLLMFPTLCKIATWGVYNWQWYGPILYFIPFFTGPLRTFVVFGFFCMHFGFHLSFRLDIFAWVTMSAILGLLPTWFWEKLYSFLKTKERINFKLYYSKDCSFCTYVARFFSTFLFIPETQVIGIFHQTSSARDYNNNGGEANHLIDIKAPRSAPDTFASWIIAEDHTGKMYNNFGALLACWTISPLTGWTAPIVRRFPRRALSALMRAIHSHGREPPSAPVRRQFYKKDPLSMSSVLRKAWRIFKVVVNNLLCLYFICLVISWNLATHGATFHLHGNQQIVFALHLDQGWGMFAPRPPDIHWWYNIEATLDNGTKVELFNDAALFTHKLRPHTWDKPNPFHIAFGNHRWFKYYENGINTHQEREVLRLNYGRWICREFNKIYQGGSRIHTFSIHWMSEQIDREKMDGTRIPRPKQTLWNHMCYEKPQPQLPNNNK